MDFSKVTIGVNSEVITEYLEKIKADVIEEAIKKLESEQDALFTIFKANWKGISEDNFEENMETATLEVKNALETHYNILEGKIYAIHNAWIKQDQNMVQTGGNN